jgi:predicted transcriptional regulator
MTQTNTNTTTLTFRVDKQTKEKLEQEAKRTKRSKAFLVQEVVADYLHVLEQQDEMVRVAIASADRGELISHEDMMAWVNSLDTNSPLPSPKVTK